MFWFWWFGAPIPVLTNRGPVIEVPVEYRATLVPGVDRWAPRLCEQSALLCEEGALLVLDIGGAWIPVSEASRATVVSEDARTAEVPAEYRITVVAE